MLEWARGLGLTPAELARRIGESQQVLNNWRRRGAIPGRKLAKVAGALEGVTVEELLTGKRRGVGLGVHEDPASYDSDTLRMAREIESLPPPDRAHIRWLLTRLLNAPPGTGR